jgi:hypothetical protein
MPWNDTAQLNYLIPAVREAVIQTILSVARRFPIIRFDAAMTLAKKHYQRLWYPEPGLGGAIPSRAEYGLTKEQFNTLFPSEFWREVVDRAASEVPDTLLLAEAFWLMEGYFVRTLGMHRVYNSAFMNMLRNEENSKYRTLIKTTLEFEPEILKRYVNFMNNPDERTAVDQFGKGDKYFGICVLMATLPGLPMFGHGQVEGLTEKYGMEYKRAYLDEQPDPYLVDKHKREIFPLLHHRAIFADVQNFNFYDFSTPSGSVDENVFAYTNRFGDERALVVFNNRYSDSSGWIRRSCAVVERDQGAERYRSQKSLSEGLSLRAQDGLFIIARDQITNLEYIFRSRDLAENGLYLSLGAYEHHVFLDFREAIDDEMGSYHHLSDFLNGRGVPRVSDALRELVLQPVLAPFGEIVDAGFIAYLSAHKRGLVVNDSPLISPSRKSKRSPLPKPSQLSPEVVNAAEEKLNRLLDGIQHMKGFHANRSRILTEFRAALSALLSLEVLASEYPLPASKNYAEFLAGLAQQEINPIQTRIRWVALSGWIYLRGLGLTSGSGDPVETTRSMIEEWRLLPAIEAAALAYGIPSESSGQVSATIRLLIGIQSWYTKFNQSPLRQMVTDLFGQEEVRQFISVNRYKGILWFNQEAFTELIQWLSIVAVIEALSDPGGGAAVLAERALICRDLMGKLQAAEKVSEYQVEKLFAAL